MSHTVQYTAHNGGWFAWVNGRRIGWMRRELRNHPRRSAHGAPMAWSCWRLYRDGAPYTTGETRREAALAARDRDQKKRTTA